MSGFIGEDLAVATMRQGAADYLLKDRLVRLEPAVGRVQKRSAEPNADTARLSRARFSSRQKYLQYRFK